MNQEGALHVRISKATNVVWEGEANSVSSINAEGPFDILPMHANFVTLIKGQLITVRDLDGNEQQFDFKQAVIYVENNQVKIYSDIA